MNSTYLVRVCVCLRVPHGMRGSVYLCACASARVCALACVRVRLCVCVCVSVRVRVRARVTGVPATHCLAPPHDRHLVTIIEHVIGLRQVGRVLPRDRRTQKHERYIPLRHAIVSPAGTAVMNIAVPCRVHDHAARRRSRFIRGGPANFVIDLVRPQRMPSREGAECQGQLLV